MPTPLYAEDGIEITDLPALLSAAGVTGVVVAAAGGGFLISPAMLVSTPARSYDTTLSSTLPAGSPGQGDGVVFAPASTQRLRYDTLATTNGNPVQLTIKDSTNQEVSFVTLAQEYSGRPFAFDRADGTTYTGPFPSADLTLTA